MNMLFNTPITYVLLPYFGEACTYSILKPMKDIIFPLVARIIMMMPDTMKYIDKIYNANYRGSMFMFFNTLFEAVYLIGPVSYVLL